ncbi:MAG: FtsX-like permease family protein [Fervidobacterium sp.]
MIVKIAFRNFTKHWKVGLLAILGTMVATMLLVGGLSLGDSVGIYLKNKVEKNFGSIDLIIKDKADTIYFPKGLDVEKMNTFLNNNPKITKFVPVKLAQITAYIGNKYVDLFAIPLTADFRQFIGKNINKVTISSDTAESLGLSVGSEIEIVTAQGSYKVKIEALGEQELNFRGENGSANGTIFLPESLFNKLGIYPLKAPNVYFASTNLPIDSHGIVAQELSKEGSIRVKTAKYDLQSSPLNKIIGYLFIGFSGFSVLSSFLFISSFFGIISEERKSSLGVLRAIGYSRPKMFSVLFIEGLLYLAISEIVGALIGVGFGKFLVYRMNSFNIQDDLFVSVQDKIPYAVTMNSIIIAVSVAMLVPILILIYRSIQFSNMSPAELYTDRILEPTGQSGKRKKIRLFVLGLIAVIALCIVSPLYGALLFLSLVPLFYPETLVMLVYGVAIIAVVIPNLGTGSPSSFLARAGFLLIASIYIVFAFIPYLKALLERFKNVSLVLALSYIEKHKMRNFTIFVIYSVTLILILVSAIVPYSINKFVDSKKEEGAFGYNFIIVENPIKTFFGSYKYLNDATFTANFDTLVPIQLVEGQVGNDKDKYSFIISDAAILKDLKLPSDKIMKELQKTDLSKIPDKSVYLSDEIRLHAKENEKTAITLKGILPGISPRITDEFTVLGTYSTEEILLPLGGLIMWKDKKLFGSVNGYVGIIRDPKTALETQEFVTRKFDGAFYITGEIEKMYASVNNLINMALQLFYLGFIAGFSGLAIMTFRNVYARKKEIGMLRAVGAKSSVVFRMFIYEALMIVTMATLVGVLSSAFIITDLKNFISPTISSFKMYIPFWQVFLTIASVFLITTGFVMIPANMSKNIPPSEALRVYD